MFLMSEVPLYLHRKIGRRGAARLQSSGFKVWGPGCRDQCGGVTGIGRVADVEERASGVEKLLQAQCGPPHLFSERVID